MKFYKPGIIYIILDAIVLSLVFGVVLGWFPLTTQTPFAKYSSFCLIFAALWIVVSYFFKRYKRDQGYFEASLNLFYTALSVFAVLWLLIQFFFDDVFSERVLPTITIGALSVRYVLLFVYYAYRYAVSYDIPKGISTDIPRENAQVIPAEPINEEQYETLISLMKSLVGEKATEFLEKTTDLRSGNLRVFFENNIEELKLIKDYQYSTFIQLKKLNNMRKVNAMFWQINAKLADNGIFICRFESKSAWKKSVLNKYPKYLNNIVYSFYFFVKRVIPHLFLTRRLYYDVTGGRKRIFSKAEVLGRLVYLGFEIVGEKKIDGLSYVIAKRVANPQLLQQRKYGPFIKLPRIGKNGKQFNFYKLRTMHSYSEYLQPYVFEKNKLQEGGKIKRDFRVTTLGHFARKYWLDELPMIINLLKGDMKIVGVRPLSQHYFSLYSKELQEKRVKFKPGLFPPFYADMPKTLDEIQQSEMNYLTACETKGVFVTDVRYFFKIVNNILFKGKRSA